MDSPSTFGEFLSAHPIDYAFVCIDQLADGDSPRQDVVYCALSEAAVPFIDSGVSITLDDHAVRGVVTTSADAAGCVAWKEAIPNARVKGNVPGYRNVQWRCCTARSKSLTSLCRLQSHPAQYVSGIPSAAILLSISHPIRCSTRCLANVRARISGPMIAL